MTPLQPRILTDDVQKDQTKLEQPCRNIFWVMRGSKYMLIMMMKYILGNDIHKIYWVMMFKGKTKLDQWWIRKGKWYFPAQGARLECYPPHYKIAIVQCRKMSPGPWLWGLSREKRDEEAKKVNRQFPVCRNHSCKDIWARLVQLGGRMLIWRYLPDFESNLYRFCWHTVWLVTLPKEEF